MMSRKGPSEETAANTTGTYKFVGEGWSSEYLKSITEPKTITEPTDSYMITTVTQWYLITELLATYDVPVIPSFYFYSSNLKIQLMDLQP